jgi:hypothetical protein
VALHNFFEPVSSPSPSSIFLCSESERLTWEDPPLHTPARTQQDAYLPVLSRFRSLRFFAYDRRSPPPLDHEGQPMLARQSRLEYDALSQLVRACPSLSEAVAIVSDVSEG